MRQAPLPDHEEGTLESLTTTASSAVLIKLRIRQGCPQFRLQRHDHQVLGALVSAPPLDFVGLAGLRHATVTKDLPESARQAGKAFAELQAAAKCHRRKLWLRHGANSNRSSLRYVE